MFGEGWERGDLKRSPTVLLQLCGTAPHTGYVKAKTNRTPPTSSLLIHFILIYDVSGHHGPFLRLGLVSAIDRFQKLCHRQASFRNMQMLTENKI